MAAADTFAQRLPRLKGRAHLFGWMGSSDRDETGIPPSPPEHCPRCSATLPERTHNPLRVCPDCGLHLRLPARDRIAALVDDGSFRERDAQLASGDPLDFHDERAYRARLLHQFQLHEHRDAIVTGTASIGDIPVVIGVLDFAFMGGSMGLVVGEKLAAAAELAVEERRPLVTVVASGGARMQEGMFALWQMGRTAAAIKRLRAKGIPYISVLTDPTTGGVYASFASLGDVILAEPEALIGFAGPRVAEAMTGEPLPEGSHRAEYLLGHGHIDAVVPRPALRQTIHSILAVWQHATSSDDEAVRPREEWQPDPDRQLPDPWELTQQVRLPDRPSTSPYIRQIVSGFIPLAGDRINSDDPAVIGGFGHIAGMPVMVVGLDRGHDRYPDEAPLRPLPAGFRKAHRLMTLAARWRLPLVLFVDTPGAWPGIESEQEGLAGAIAQNLALLSDLPTPTISVVVGEGGSGGALAFAVADRMLMQERATFSVIAPEGAAAILYRDADRAEELARSLRLTARDLEAFGMIDGIIAEPEDGAAADPELAAQMVERALVSQLDELRRYDARQLIKQRYERIRRLGDEHIAAPSRPRRVARWLRKKVRSDGPHTPGSVPISAP
ncbi:MAG: acetyl-CoA carboxylase carboxyl transferase subunit beta [Chloroflexota bacterium]|nr:acetyl-CoA carboxylase carboxyl transferase subunit beta [Chloroflexota bacterium]